MGINRRDVRSGSTSTVPGARSTCNRAMLPSLLLTNANHVLNKLDELYLLVAGTNPALDIISITESWLSPDIPNSLCDLPDFTIFRRDRKDGLGGGVMCYARDNLNGRVIEPQVPDNIDLEVLWVSMRPKVLPRPLGLLLVVTVYCPPWYDAGRRNSLRSYISNGLDWFASTHPNAGFLVVGDFNSLDTTFLTKYHGLKQMVKGHTRGEKTLDKIFTNCENLYATPEISAPIGRSDHNCVVIRSSGDVRQPVGYKSVVRRSFSNSAYDNIAKGLLSVNWSHMYSMNNCQEQANFLYSTLHGVVDKFAPTTEFRLRNNDKPWVTKWFKDCVEQRNKAFSSGDTELYKVLRNRVNRLGNDLRKRYFNQKIALLKKENNRRWWREVKSLCGFNQKQNKDFDNVCYHGSSVGQTELPDVINSFLATVAEGVPKLDNASVASLRSKCADCPDSFIVSEFDVYNVLCRLQDGKACLGDVINNKLLRTLADVLAAPICSVINASIRQAYIPEQWKISRISVLPKITPVRNIETDIRPIAITCSISKVAEYFISKFFEEHFEELQDVNQFGSTSGRSTTLALIKLSHLLFEASDDSRNIIRVLFIDFKKAFELIDHNILSKKLSDYDFPPQLAVWMLSFLFDRKQFVRIGSSVSDVILTNAGAPQGTLAGPNDFKVLINDLCFETIYVKYVDDVTVAAISDNPRDNDMQSVADKLVEWCNDNRMRINTSKTNEMLIYFGKTFIKSDITVTMINNTSIKRVETFKLLGVIFSSDLTWRAHVDYIISKASKRIFVVYQLVRSGLCVNDVIAVYSSLIRSVLEYACPVWHCGLTKGQSDEIEGVQKRCLKILFPDLSYKDSLQITGLELLSLRRESQVRKLFNEIKCEGHVLNNLLPANNVNNSSYRLRDTYPYKMPRARTDRLLRSFIWYCVRKRY